MAEPTAPLLDFSDFFGSQHMSDVTIAIVMDTEERPDDERPAKRARTDPNKGLASAGHCEIEELPGHGVLLAGYSSYMKTELMRWQQPIPAQQQQPATQQQQPTTQRQSANSAAQQQQGSCTRPRVVLRVSCKAEMAAVRAMLAYMYTSSLPEDATQAMLLSMLLLSDRFDVQACALACSDSLSKQQLAEDTLMQVLALPPFYHECPLFESLMSKAADELQSLLGDLELAWATESGKALFLQLPLKGVELLLADARTRVHYENTALVAVASWVQLHSDSLAAADNQRLAQQIRLPYITPFFAASVATQLPWLVEALGSHTIACSIAMGHTYSNDSSIDVGPDDSGMTWPKSWMLGRRPESLRTSVNMVWKPRLTTVQTAFKRGQYQSRGSSLGGLSWSLQLRTHTKHNAGNAASGIEEPQQQHMYIGVRVCATIDSSCCELPGRGPVIALRSGSLTTVDQIDEDDSDIVDFADVQSPFIGAAGQFTCRLCCHPAMTDWQPDHFADFVDGDGRLNLCLRLNEFA